MSDLPKEYFAGIQGYDLYVQKKWLLEGIAEWIGEDTLAAKMDGRTNIEPAVGPNYEFLYFRATSGNGSEESE